MSRIVETNEEGAIHLSPELLGEPKPHTRYVVEVDGDTLTLRPEANVRPFWATATPQERADAFRRWANKKRPPAPPLPDEALRRENIYD
jgi:hypothetical protein